MDPDHQTLGHRRAIQLVRRFMEREPVRGGTRSLSHPVLIFEGARGSGKSALLDAVAHRLDQGVPHARVDFEQHRAASVPEVLSAIAFQLGNTYERYGSLRFPLLTIGRMVMRATLPETRPEARAAVQRLLTAQINLDTMRSILRDAAGALAPELPSVIRPLWAIVIDGLLRVLRRAWSPSPDWYGHRDRGFRNNPLDVLVNLNRWVHDDQTTQINELLWEAFLADLRDDFRNSSYASEMTLNCVVLLDDADTPLGQEFVNGLVDARRSRLALGNDPADPLTAIVTSRGELLADVATPDPAWYRHTLRDLSEHETTVMVSALPPNIDNHVTPIGNHQLTSMVYGLAGGHPASTAMLVAALREHPLEHGDTLAALLNRQEPGHDPDRSLVGDRLLHQLLGEFTEDTYEDLVTCAAARTKHHASLLAARGELLVGGLNSYREIAPVLWPASGGAGPEVLRRLLQRRLAARTADDAANWTKVVDWFRARCAEDGDEEGVLHYAMAAGDIATTCEGLRQRLSGDPVVWVELLRSVTSMPRRPADPRVPPMDQMRALIDRRSPRLTRLVVARWVAFDPFVSDRRRALHRQIATDYEFVAGIAHGDPEPLLNEADYHRKQAEVWS